MRYANEFANQSFDCACGQRHSVAIKRIETGEGALAKIARCVPPGCKNVLVVADRHTYPACGEAATGYLSQIADVRVLVYPQEHLIPDEQALGRLMFEMNGETDLIVAAGSGTINDLCRFASHAAGRPYMVCASAPSMDGYASANASIIVDGRKQTRQTHYASAIIADTAVLRKAPERLRRYGIGDILGKFTALADWRLAAAVNGEYYCPYCAGLIEESLTAVVSDIQSGNAGSVDALLNALLISGIAMGMVGSSRPASGAEHHLVHYWEADLLSRGIESPPHGGAVGIAELLVLRLYETLKHLLPPGIGVPEAGFVEALLKSAHCMTDPAQVGVDGALLKKSILHAREVRPRFTVLGFAHERGLLSDFAEKTALPPAGV